MYSTTALVTSTEKGTTAHTSEGLCPMDVITHSLAFHHLFGEWSVAIWTEDAHISA
jgi:hypothetical protein